ncbi:MULTISPECIES: hypothetical protein [Pseudomonas]|uniref:Uncharacterized protein n=1 Tax=Pseudomonas marincola TaxID=437900 RepID=A0A1I7D5S4_9PSED|nr:MULTISPECIES: hypothetical protein [Pseudomonas]CAE6888371.1 conserved protein of unknown function [Pseudomonas marincola]SFU07048.1 hypothetical protein SAMN05216264_11062 [Pseudomonas marincola]
MMRMSLAVAAIVLSITGCVGGAHHEKACKVFSPVEIESPTTNQDQRIDVESSEDMTNAGDEQTNC